MTAPDVGHRRAGRQLVHDAVKRWQPGGDQVVDVAGPEEPLGAVEQVRVVLVPAESGSGAEPLFDRRHVAQHTKGELHAAGDEGWPILDGKRERLFRCHRVQLFGRVVVDIPASRLVGQPGPHVCRRCPGAVGQFLGRHRGAVRHRAVQAEPVADDDERGTDSGAKVTDRAADELLENGLVRRGLVLGSGHLPLLMGW